MKDSPDKNLTGTGSTPDPLARAFHEAAAAHAAALKRGHALEILTTYRAALVAEVTLLRDSGGHADVATADAVAWEIERVDRDLADLAVGGPRSNGERA